MNVSNGSRPPAVAQSLERLLQSTDTSILEARAPGLPPTPKKAPNDSGVPEALKAPAVLQAGSRRSPPHICLESLREEEEEEEEDACQHASARCLTEMEAHDTFPTPGFHKQPSLDSTHTIEALTLKLTMGKNKRFLQPGLQLGVLRRLRRAAEKSQHSPACIAALLQAIIADRSLLRHIIVPHSRFKYAIVYWRLHKRSLLAIANRGSDWPR